jgi:NAD(P)-dependent dehydrogenase (short-subunit alcohol dehydrogenase family)
MSSTVLITGANRGIGLELTRQYLGAGWHVIATARDPAGSPELQQLAATANGRLMLAAVDLADFATIDALAARFSAASIDLVINNAGHFGPRNDAATDLAARLRGQSFGSVDYDAALATLRINAYAPLRIAELFLEHLKRGSGRKFVTISSSAGSIANGLRWESPVQLFVYPVSKAALNKVTATLAMVLKRDGITTVALCPGHVRTRLGGPGAALTPEESVTGLRRVIDSLSPADNGRFIRYDGESVPW